MARKSRKAAPAEPKQEHVWRAALYIRLSNESNNGRGDSLETQRQIMETYISLCPDIEIAGIYTDNGITGRTFERESFQRMLQDMDNGEINCVVVKDLSRLGRSSIDTGFYVEKYFPLRHIRLISVNDQYDSEEDDNSGGHIIVPLKNMMNEAYAADIGRKIRSQKRTAMREGAFIGSFAPYGYKKDPTGRRLLVNGDTAPIVRRIFQWAADGIPMRETVRRLNEGGVLTPGCYLASAGIVSSGRLIGGGIWQLRIVERILRDEVYIGDLVQGKHSGSGHKRSLVSPENWIVTRNAHEPVISREMFAKVQDIRTEAAEKYAASGKTASHKNILRGKVFCGYCGRFLKRRKSGRHYYYGCVSNSRIRKEFCPNGISCISADKLFGVVLTNLRREAKIVIENICRLKRSGGGAADEKAAAEHEILELRSEIEEKRARQASLYQGFVDGALGRAEYMRAKEDYNQEIRQAAERARFLRERQRCMEQEMEAYSALAERLAALDKETVLTASLVEETIERVTVDESGGVSIRFRFNNTLSGLIGAVDDEQE